jgi:enamine deaminase RidA (YjgF/YER057c/UK114 family)
VTTDTVVRAAAAAVAALVAGCLPPAGGRAMGGPGMEPSGPRYINPGTLAALDGFTHAVKVGLTIYVSGQVALDSAGQLVGPGDLGAQARQAFANLSQVLKIAGAVPSDVTKLNIYVVNYRPQDFATIREAGAEYFPQRNPPAGLVLGVQSLPKAGLLIAVDAIAVTRGMFPERRPEDRYPRE